MNEICIRDHTGASAVILPDKGATVVSYIAKGLECFYRDDGNLTSNERPRCGIPFLFPVFGRTPADSIYPMDIHGFGHTSSWRVIASTSSSLSLDLISNEETRKVYPFHFRVQLTFSLDNGCLSIRQKYENLGSEPMPYAFGFHPYFAVGDVEQTAVEFQADYEMNMVTGKPTPCERTSLSLAFPAGANETGAFLMNAREAATIHTKDGGKIRMHFDQNFTRLVLWAVANKGFLCVEPINSSPNGLVTGDCLYLEPNECKEAVISFDVL